MARVLDLTSLSGKETESDIQYIVDLAYQHSNSVYAICVYPQWIEIAKTWMRRNQDTKIVTVVNFPEGNHTEDNIKIQTWNALDWGADEIDIVFPTYERCNIIGVTKKECGKIPLKVIIGSGNISPNEIVERTKICLDNGVNFIKTSTGKTKIGARLGDAALILQTILWQNAQCGLKVSQGIKTNYQAQSFADLYTLVTCKKINADCFRIGSSNLVEVR